MSNWHTESGMDDISMKFAMIILYKNLSSIAICNSCVDCRSAIYINYNITAFQTICIKYKYSFTTIRTVEIKKITEIGLVQQSGSISSLCARGTLESTAD